MNRLLIISITLAVSTILFASFTAYLLTTWQPHPVEYIYIGAYKNSLLFQSENNYLAYNVYTHETVTTSNYRDLLNKLNEATK